MAGREREREREREALLLRELEAKFLEMGLLINAKKTHVISSIPDDPLRFRIGGLRLFPTGPTAS